MKTLLAIASTLALGAAQPTIGGQPIPPNAPPGSTYYSDGTPPTRYQGEVAQVVLYVNDVAPYCGKTADPNYTIIACTSFQKGVAVTVLPNPCAFDNERFAHIACHEKGHALGWPAWHPPH